MNIKYKTDKGRVRDTNQDFVLVLEEDNYSLLIVADGMGGHNAGEIASKIASLTIKDFVGNSFEDYDEKDELIRDAILKANHEVHRESLKDNSCKGMGTTVTCCLIEKGKLYLGHVGDSRAYIVNETGIRKISEDHSFVQELINKGSITESEARLHPQRNLITRAVGIEEHVVIDTKIEFMDEKDLVFLCSDGLTSYVTEDEILTMIRSSQEGVAEELINLANERGGNDNISVIIAGKDDGNE